MKKQYEFSKGKRGRVAPEPRAQPRKVRAAIRLDEELIDLLCKEANRSAGAITYGTLVNIAVRENFERTPRPGSSGTATRNRVSSSAPKP